MRCPECGDLDSRVVDSRPAADAIRRRRECPACGARWTTHERVERRLPWIVKKDGRREPFAREKVLHGLALACRKRPFDAGQLDEMVRKVETTLEQSREPEVPSSVVGAAVMQVLAETDEVAYVRFASVYREFDSVDAFVQTIRDVRRHRTKVPDDAPPRPKSS